MSVQELLSRLGVASLPVGDLVSRSPIDGAILARLRADKRNSESLHVIARVYLARNQPDKAVAPARLAATAGSGFARGAAFATLASAYLALAQLRGATRGVLVRTSLRHPRLGAAVIRQRHRRREFWSEEARSG